MPSGWGTFLGGRPGKRSAQPCRPQVESSTGRTSNDISSELRFVGGAGVFSTFEGYRSNIWISGMLLQAMTCESY